MPGGAGDRSSSSKSRAENIAPLLLPCRRAAGGDSAASSSLEGGSGARHRAGDRHALTGARRGRMRVVGLVEGVSFCAGVCCGRI